METRDLVIIGGGQCGVPLARAYAAARRGVTLVEAKHLGGSCVNFGCTPSKAAFASGRALAASRRAGDLGIRIGPAEADFAAVMKRARGFAEDGRRSLERSFADANGNPDMVAAYGRLAGRDGERFVVAAGERRILADAVVLDTGTRSAMPKIAGLAEIPVITAENWLDLTECPAHLILLGGGTIGLEMAQFFRRMGSAVTLVADADRLAPHEDADVSAGLRAVLETDGVHVRTEAEVEHAAVADGGGVRLTLRGGASIEGSHLFVATGRKPNTDDLGLETVGLGDFAGKSIEVDGQRATSVAGLYAAGDIRGGPAFTHTSYDDYLVLRSRLLGDGSHRAEGRVTPSAIFTDPELGRVGMTEAEARKAHPGVKVVRRDFADMGRARENGRPEGFVKLVATADGNRLLGAAVLGESGAELAQLFVAVLAAGGDLSAMREAIYTHPTLAEGVHQAVVSLGE